MTGRSRDSNLPAQGRAYLGIKYYPDMHNRALIETLSQIIEQTGWQITITVRDLELWGKKALSPQQLMQLSFDSIQRSNVLFLEVSEKGVGLGIEAGYAYALHIPIILLARIGTEISTTLSGIASQILFYEQFEDLLPQLIALKI